VAPPPLFFNLFSYVASLTALTLARVLSTTETSKPIADVNVPQDDKTQGVETRVGLELGMWLFLGSTIQIVGIQSTTAIKSAIIVQLTTVIVPILESLLVTKKPVSQRLWVSCILALVGVIICSFDGAILTAGTSDLNSVAQMLSSNLQLNTGDFLVGLSAFFYSMHVVRLGKFAIDADPVKLAQMKSFTGFTATIVLILGICLFGGDSMNNFQTFVDYLGSTLPAAATTGQYYVALAVLWNGFFATALATWAMSLGQKSVSSTLANILYSSQPIWAAIFALALLGETVSTTNFIGSSVLLAAILISLIAPPPTPKE
jgi:drug/metabolite transporter (DMT)-like permease